VVIVDLLDEREQTRAGLTSAHSHGAHHLLLSRTSPSHQMGAVFSYKS
jgi:hypothetical protein